MFRGEIKRQRRDREKGGEKERDGYSNIVGEREREMREERGFEGRERIGGKRERERGM